MNKPLGAFKRYTVTDMDGSWLFTSENDVLELAKREAVKRGYKTAECKFVPSEGFRRPFKRTS